MIPSGTAPAFSRLPRPIISIHQPAYLPWLGYLDRIRRSDLFIFLDTVQFQKNSFQNRNKVRTAQGSTWLTVPVQTRDHLGHKLHELLIDNRQNWRRKHWQTIMQSYARAPHARELFSWLEPFYGIESTYLADFCFDMLKQHVAAFGIVTPLKRARDMPDPGSHKSDLVLDLCRSCGAQTYLSGPLGRNYLDLDAFAAAGIAVVFDSFQHPVYPQNYPGFESHMAAIDFLANVEQPAAAMVRTAGDSQMMAADTGVSEAS